MLGVCKCVCLCICACEGMCPRRTKVGGRPLNLKLQVIEKHLTQMLGTELRFSAEAVSLLYCRSISPASGFKHLKGSKTFNDQIWVIPKYIIRTLDCKWTSDPKVLSWSPENKVYKVWKIFKTSEWGKLCAKKKYL